MATLASLRILLGLDAGGVKSGGSGVRGELRGIQVEANKTQQTLSQIGKGAAAGLGIGAGLGAFQVASRAVGEFTSFLGDSVKAAIDEEAGIRRLGQSLSANVADWDGNTDAVERTIASREALAFSDDDLRTSLGSLVGATHDVQKALDIQSTAMDLARFKNISLQSASEALIKVEGGRFRALQALGIQLRDGATATEALAAVQAVASGQAKAFGDTTAGAMQAAAIAVQDLQEEIGAQLAPAVRDAANFLRNDIIPAIKAAGDAANEARPLIEGMARALGLILPGKPDPDTLPAVRFDPSRTQDIAADKLRTDAANELSVALQQVNADEQAGKITADQATAARDAATAANVDALAAADALANGFDGMSAKAQESARALLTASEHADTLTAAQTAATAAAQGMDAAQRSAAAVAVDLANKTGDATLATDLQRAAVKAMGSAFDGFNVAASQSASASDQFGFTNRAAMDKAVAAMKDAGVAADNLTDDINLIPRDIEITASLNSASVAAVEAGLTRLRGLGETGGAGVSGALEGGGGPIVAPFEQTIPIKDPGVIAWEAEQKRLREQAARDALQAAQKAAAEQAAAYRDRLSGAFDAVRHAAERYFDDLHTANLKAIKDAHDHANALLDAQKAANLAPVNEAQAAQQAIQQQRELAQRQADLAAAQAEQVGSGSGQVSADQKAQDVLRAQQALADFNAAARIAAMQAEAETANAAIDVEKAKNDALAATATQAENDRATAQREAFANDLKALEDSLSKHPETWAKTQQAILKLLMGYGVDYKKAAQNLGDQFAAGLLASTRAAEEAGAALANAAGGKLGVQPKPVTAGTGAAAMADLGELRVDLGPITLMVDGEELNAIIERKMAARYSRVGSGIGG